MKIDEKNHVNNKIKNIEKTIWSEYSKEDCVSTILDYKQIINNVI